MRKAFVKALLEEAEGNPNLMVLTADLGYSVFEDFAKKHKDRFVNMGIAEANMVGVAAGLAMCGKLPVAYSITPFITARPLEQVRVDVCYHNLPVLLVGTGAGLYYGTLGPTHHGTEDLALMRAMPNMTVLAPCGPYELGALVKQALRLGAPAYIRIGGSAEPEAHEGEKKPGIAIGKGAKVEELGGDFAILACDSAVFPALQALRSLSGLGKKGLLYSMHTIKPLDKKLVLSLGQEMPIFTIEEHSVVGGLGSAVLECLSDAGKTRHRVFRIALPDAFQKQVGTRDYLRKANGLDSESIKNRILESLKG
jgi:transketolase